MTDDDLDLCQTCGDIATVWWPAVDGQWCDRHVPDEAAEDIAADDYVDEATPEELETLRTRWQES